MRDGRSGCLQANALHGLVEPFPILGLVDGVLAGTDQLDAETLEHAFPDQVQRAIERRLPAHGRQQRTRPLLLDDARHGGPLHRLDVRRVGHGGIRHDGGGIGVDENHPEAFLAQRFAGLSAGVVELAGLADHDGPRAENEDGIDIGTLRHGAIP